MEMMCARGGGFRERLGKSEQLRVDVEAVIFEAGEQRRVLAGERGGELGEIARQAAGDGEKAQRGDGGSPGFEGGADDALGVLVAAVKGLRGGQQEEFSVEPTTEPAAAGGLHPVDVIRKAIASGVENTF